MYTVYLVISLPNIPYIHGTYMALANPVYQFITSGSARTCARMCVQRSSCCTASYTHEPLNTQHKHADPQGLDGWTSPEDTVQQQPSITCATTLRTLHVSHFLLLLSSSSLPHTSFCFSLAHHFYAERTQRGTATYLPPSSTVS